MTKVATIASLNRVAARSEAEFQSTVQNLLDEADHERTADFFDKFNIPRSVGLEDALTPLPKVSVTPDKVGTYAEEKAISDGIQKTMIRHERKLKWHANHPSIEGAENIMLLVRAACVITDMRLTRLRFLLNSKEELTPVEWALAREFMNRSYLSIRNFLNLLSGTWLDAMLTTFPREDVTEKLSTFYEFIDSHVQVLEQHHDKLEERRVSLTVVPEGFAPVKPPNYFGGDLMGVGPWKQFWANFQGRAHHFRECMG